MRVRSRRAARRLLIVVACAASGMQACSVDERAPPSTSPTELSADALRSATYRNPYVREGEVTLDQGVFRDTARRVGVFFQPEYAVGDLDGDGWLDAAVILATTTGGSGTFQDLAVVLNRQGIAVNEATLFLGDRVPVDRIRVVEGEVQVDLTMHGPADPMCCPSEEVTRRFRYESGALLESDPPTDEPE